jgi:cobalt-zinc-cadmium resistance protein CzcA
LITATLLTLVVLPTLFYITRKHHFRLSIPKKGVAIIALLVLPMIGWAQTDTLSLSEALEMAQKNNPALKAESIAVEQSELNIKTAFDLQSTSVYYSYDENNIARNNKALRVFGITQNFEFPTTTIIQKKLLQKEFALKSEALLIQQKNLEKVVRDAYFFMAYYQILLEEKQILDSLFTAFARAAKRRFELGETNYVDYLSAESRLQKISLEIIGTAKELDKAQVKMRKMLFLETDLRVETGSFFDLTAQENDTTNYLGKHYYDLELIKSKQALKFHKSQMAPEIQVEFFTGTNNLTDRYYNGVQVGLALPILSSSQYTETQIRKLEQKKAEWLAMDYEAKTLGTIEQLMVDIKFLKEEIAYYQSTGASLNQQLIDAAAGSYRNGEIGTYEYTQIFEEAKRMHEQYLSTLLSFHLKDSELKHLTAR